MQEKRTIFLSDKCIDYTLDRGQRKNTYLCISNGELVVKVPPKFPIKEIERIINSKKDWIFKKLSNSKKIVKELKYQNGEIISIVGQPYILEIIHNAKKNYVKMFEGRLIVTIHRGNPKNVIDEFLFTQVKNEVLKSLEKNEKLVGLKATSIKVKKLNKNWGWCSSSGDISINKNLVFYPIQAIDYVVLHEICHLKYLNHSKDFWNMVEFYMPEYKDVRELLK